MKFVVVLRSAAEFASSFKQALSESAAAEALNRSKRDNLQKFLDGYRKQEAEQQAIIDSIDPERPASIDSVMLANSRLQALGLFITSTLEKLKELEPARNEFAWREGYRNQQILQQEAWRARLRERHQKMVMDINALDPQSLDFEAGYGPAADLAADVDAIKQAIEDAEKNLLMLRPAQRTFTPAETPQDRMRKRQDHAIARLAKD
jgi:hypothetical protein